MLSTCHFGPLNPQFYLGLPDPPLKVLKPTVSRESFWNQSIKKWSDITSPFILNDNIICFIVCLDVFSAKNGYQKNTKKIRTPGPPPSPYLGLIPKFYQFFGGFPNMSRI